MGFAGLYAAPVLRQALRPTAADRKHGLNASAPVSEQSI
jgi:hypothetical protein